MWKTFRRICGNNAKKQELIGLFDCGIFIHNSVESDFSDGKKQVEKPPECELEVL